MTLEAFQSYRRKQIAELRPYIEGEILSGRVSISAPDREAGSPKSGDMIARNPKNHDDQWLVAAAYFADNFEAAPSGQAPLEGVKALEWNRRNSDGTIHIATALPGEYWAWELAGFGYWSWGSLVGREVHGGLEEAKAAAQADFEARIRSALLPASAEPVAEDGYELAETVHGEIVQIAKRHNPLKEPLASPPASGAVEAGWRDITTAPKDGTAILALNSRHIAHPPIVVRWRAESILGDDAEPHWCDAATANGGALYYNSLYFDYWQPIPAAPTEGR